VTLSNRHKKEENRAVSSLRLKAKGNPVILAAGLTPAWQQILVFDSFALGEVNRARGAYWCASGKVLNLARALHLLGAPAKALTAVGGISGEQVRNDFAYAGIPARWIGATTPTRVCTTILNTTAKTATELVPNAQELSESDLASFRNAYAEEARSAQVVALIGSLPIGTLANFYRDLLPCSPGLALVDARGPELLAALEAKPFLVKPNRKELEFTLGRQLRGEKELLEAMKELNQRGASWVVITDGANPVYASCDRQCYRLQPPKRDVVNPIGCGDCMAAGIAWALHQGGQALDAIRFGVATAADKVGQRLPGVVDPQQVERLVESIELTVL
jgi:1-phosphofructokinase family hexose kinase